MAGQLQLDAGGAWLPEHHSETHSLGLLDDSLLRELSAELGGNPNPPAAGSTGCISQGQQQQLQQAAGAAAQHHQQQHVGGMALLHHQQQQLRNATSVPVGAQFLGASDMQQVLSLLQSQNSLPQGLPMAANAQQQQQHFGLAAPGFGSAPEHQQALVNSLNSNNNLMGQQQQQQQQLQPMLMYRSAFGGAMGGGGKIDGQQQHQQPPVSKTHSPSNSNSAGNQQCGVDDSLMDLYDTQRGANKGGGGGAVNKGALAQKRFRERQKEKMRASEAQVAELTRKLGQLEVEKARLSSRTRLLEQVVSLNLLHEAKLHTNREIMVREQEMLLEDLAAFVLQLAAVANGNNSSGSSPNSPERWQQQGPAAAAAAAGGGRQQQQQQQQQGLYIGGEMLMPSLQQQHQRQHQQQHMNDQQQLQQQDVMALLQQQQQQQGQVGGPAGQHPSSSSSGSSGSRPNSGQVVSLSQTIRGWTVSHMVDSVFPRYIACLQQLLSVMGSSSPVRGSNGSNAAAATAHQQVEELVLKRREMTDRHALFSHYYWAVWCFNRGDLAAQQLAPPDTQQWAQVLQHLNLSKEQTDAIVAARTNLLTELHRVAADWQHVLPTLALQLLQVPRAQWHTVGAVQAMVTNLAAEREAVVGFLHTLIDEVLTPVQEGELEARSYPWCPDVWAIAGAAAAAQAAAAPKPSAGDAGTGGSGRGKGGRKPAAAAAAAAAAAQQQAQPQQGLDEDPMAALAMGTDVLQPLMPFMTAFQLLRAPVTAKGAGLRLKRALLLDPFRTVVPAAAYPQPTAAEVYSMSLLDAHCGTFQQVMLWDWLKLNLPSYVSMLGMQTSLPGNGGGSTTAAPAAAAPPQPQGFMGVGHHTLQPAAGNPMGQQFYM